MTEQEMVRFRSVLEALDPCYDETVHMLAEPFSSPGYHTRLTGGTVHRTRESLVYALALLDSEAPSYRERAMSIIDRVLSLQDTDPASHTYGIWSWFYEEPLAEMAPPDWNWADFLGKTLLELLCDYNSVLGQPRVARMEHAVRCACDSIVKRDAPISYTNIAVMDCLVTAMAGEWLGDQKLLIFARDKVRRVSEHIAAHGLTEYNSPTYTTVVLKDTSTALRSVRDRACRTAFAAIADAAWRCAAEHFFAPSGQWAGPHARAYGTCMDEEVAPYICRAVGLPYEADLQVYRTNLVCPAEYLPYFQKAETREVLFRFGRDNRDAPALVANTFLGARYAVGTFFSNSMWNQAKDFVVHWGTMERPCSLWLRCLHDGYDFCSAKFQGVQDCGDVLAIVNFATDGGDTHPNLDMVRDATIKASDIRLSFEIAGEVQTAGWENGGITWHSEGLTFRVQIAQAVFGPYTPALLVRREGAVTCLDVVLYHGPETLICLSELAQAYVVLAFSAEGEMVPVDVEQDGGTVRAAWKALAVETTSCPVPLSRIREASTGMRAGKQYEIWED